MDKDKFWQVIEKTIARCGSDKASYLTALESELHQLSKEELILWELFFDAYLELANKDKLWAGAFILNKGNCSEDNFDAFRGWLISLGQEFYMDVLSDIDVLAQLVVEKPESFVATFEEILYSGQEVFSEKVKRELPQDDTPWDYFEMKTEMALTAETLRALAQEISYDDEINLQWDETSSRRFKQYLPQLSKKYLADLDKNETKYEIPLD